MNIINIREYSKGIEEGVKYIHGIWGCESNYTYYYDAIANSPEEGIPQFYLLMDGDKIIGCGGLIINDFISRHDLYPWLCSLYVDEEYRGEGLGNFIMEHITKESKKLGYDYTYLTTSHNGYYEKYNWERIEDGVDLFSGKNNKIYRK